MSYGINYPEQNIERPLNPPDFDGDYTPEMEFCDLCGKIFPDEELQDFKGEKYCVNCLPEVKRIFAEEEAAERARINVKAFTPDYGELMHCLV